MTLDQTTIELIEIYNFFRGINLMSDLIVFSLAHLGAAVVIADILEKAGVRVFEYEGDETLDPALVDNPTDSESYNYVKLLDRMGRYTVDAGLDFFMDIPGRFRQGMAFLAALRDGSQTLSIEPYYYEPQDGTFSEDAETLGFSDVFTDAYTTESESF